MIKFRYVYQYLDHLGNVRLSYSDLDKSGDIDKETEIIEENNYYPFGLKHRGYNEIVNAEREHKFRFNNTELDDDFDLNWYNMPLRHQDPTTGRWNGIDPVTHFSQSTYTGFANNPIYWADPSGADETPCYSCNAKDAGGGSGLGGLAKFAASWLVGQGVKTAQNAMKTDFTVKTDFVFQNNRIHIEDGKNDVYELGNGVLMQRAENLAKDMKKAQVSTTQKVLQNVEFNFLKNSGIKVNEIFTDEALNFMDVTILSNTSKGRPISVDARLIDLSTISISEFTEGESRSIDFFSLFAPHTSNNDKYPLTFGTGLVYGHMQIRLLDRKTGLVELGFNGWLDEHDFGNPVFKFINDWLYPGEPTDYNIYCNPCKTYISTEPRGATLWEAIYNGW